MKKTLLYACFAVAAACGAPQKEPADDDFSAFAGFDEKSDKFTGSMTVVGSAGYGDTVGPFNHKAGRWSAVKFLASAGDKVTIDVTSPNGDPYTWLLDKSSEILAFNDDWKGSTNSHIEYTFKTGANTTFYIVTRDYYKSAMKFTVALKGEKPAPVCQKDVDCPASTSRNQANLCVENKCVLTAASAIACGGHTVNPHQCPADYVCEGKQMAYDAPGSCTKRCGGIRGLACDNATDICADDPNDSCDPANGGADCMGVCRGSICSGKTAKCTATTHWSQYECSCVPNVEGCGDGPACEDGSYCSFCWGTMQCIPNGALC